MRSTVGTTAEMSSIRQDRRARLLQFSYANLNHGPGRPEWKVPLANRLRQETGVTVVWLAAFP
jgi:hypothetical protein